MRRLVIPTATFVLVLSILCVQQARAALYSDDFDVDSSANWNNNPITTAGADTLAVFGFDYSTLGIPSAPNSTGGTQKGLKLQANRIGIGSAVLAGLSVSPKNVALSGDYMVRADVWLNYNGPLNGTGSGTTQYAGMGILTNGTSPQFVGSTPSAAPARTSVLVNTTVDGGNGPSTTFGDYRIFSPAVANTPYGDANMTANDTSGGGTPNFADNGNIFYTTNFPSFNVPAAGYSNSQTGPNLAGTTAFKWHDWAVVKFGNTITWTIDGIVIGAIDATTVGATSGTNFLLSFNDSNTGKSTDATSATLLFGLFDNVQVFEVVPEPGAAWFGTLVCGVTGLATCVRRGRRSAEGIKAE
jgi:hypothetical protein